MLKWLQYLTGLKNMLLNMALRTHGYTQSRSFKHQACQTGQTPLTLQRHRLGIARTRLRRELPTLGGVVRSESRIDRRGIGRTDRRKTHEELPVQVGVDLGQVAAPVFQGLLREGVIVRPVANYGMPDHLRITIGLPAENIRLLEALAKVLARG